MVSSRNGYHGCYYRVDLDRQRIETVELPETVLRRFIGGAGLGACLLHQEAPEGIDPLDPEAPLIFVFSPLVGTPLTTSAKFAVVAKSPLTYRLNDALSSSWFAMAGRRSGCDAIVIKGSCATPSVLILDDGRMRIDSAEGLWGLSVPETTRQARLKLGSHFHCAVIGPAGENQVRYATISHDQRHAGRGGLGAVMGSKRLKAIAVNGTRRVALADPQGVVEASRALSEKSFGPATAKYRELGTVANLLTLNRFEALPTRNFQQNSFEAATALSEEHLNQEHRVARQSCAACTIGCEHIYRPTGNGNEEQAARLEYESLFALGPLCGISDRNAILRASRLCDELGLDTISAGATIAFAMECNDRGFLKEPELRFGNGEKVLELLHLIGHRQGIGDRLAEGSRLLAEELGGEAPSFAPHVKGLEIPGYEPRALQTMALGFAVGSRGADHNRSGAYEVDFSPNGNRLDGKPEAALGAIETEDRSALLDSLILCKFLRGVFEDLFEESAELLRRVTGWSWSGSELRQVSRRIITTKKLYNIREGWTRAEDTLPERILSSPIPVGSAEISLNRAQLHAMVQAYYRARGWLEDGQVPPEQVQELSLTDLEGLES